MIFSRDSLKRASMAQARTAFFAKSVASAARRAKKKGRIFELTVPAEHRIKIAHDLKYQKYQHFETDITTHTVNLVPFEVGSHTGYISRENKVNIHSLHKFSKKYISLKKFTQNISAITIMSSFFIFNCRNQENWESLDPISGPFSNQ